MGGSSGGVIVRQDVKTILSNPLVHGTLTADIQAAIDPVLAKDVGDWTPADCETAAKVIAHLLCD
jgi:hypothetical protein